MRRRIVVYLLSVGLLGFVGAVSATAADPRAPHPGDCTPSGADPGKLGVILMHGKMTFSLSARRGYGAPPDRLAEIKSAIRNAGFKLASPQMPWTQDRVYSSSYGEMLGQIAGVAAELKAQGAERIVVGGHSMGANAAIGYAAQKGNVVGVIAIAPGHFPGAPGFQRATGESVAKARAMVASGHGDEQASFVDSNMGQHDTVRTTAAHYLSFFDPDGAAVIPKNVSRLRAPVLWVVAEDDPLGRLGETYFAKVPPNPLSRYLVVPGGHLEAPGEAASAVVAWLKCL